MATQRQSKNEKIFIGVSWPYASGNVHLGHLAGQYVVCDVFARFNRMIGNDVLMVSGSDSHGAPILFGAEERGIKPEELAEVSHEKITETYKQLGFVYELYTKTATENHKIVVQNVFQVLRELGFLEVRTSKQYFDPKVGRFLPDRYVRGTCPNCGNPNARGDECPECGAFLNAEDLLDPFSTLSDAKPVWKDTEHYYLNLDKVENELRDWLKDKDYWRKWVIEFSRGWVNNGLKARSATRDMSYGVPVPVEGWDGKVIYVWIEAVVGYLSAAIEWAQRVGEPSLWESYWKDPNAKHYYFIAGGNVPFHTIIWPAELIAYSKKYENDELFEKYKLPGETLKHKLDLPYDVPANKLLLLKGKKMSKGDKNGITLEKLMDKYDPDVIRYFFVKYAPENHDREFLWKDFVDANNNELVGNLGNFINRVLTFTYTRFDGKVPQGKLDSEVESQIEKAFNDSYEYLSSCNFVKAIESVLELGHFANKYFNDSKPWESVKTDPEVAGNTIYNTLQLVNALRTLIKPFLPFSGEKLSRMINIENDIDPTREVAEKHCSTNRKNLWNYDELEVGHSINKPEILFTKLEYTDDLKLADESDSGAEIAKNIEFVKSSKLENIPVIWKVYQDLTLKKKSSALDKWINKYVELIKERYSDPNWMNSPIFTGYKKLHNEYSNEKDYPSSSELLIKFILEKGTIPNINTFVDLYNVVSAYTGISIGAHDTSSIYGQPRLEILEKDLTFSMIGGAGEGIARKGEYSYVDDRGILCRLDIKQSERTKINDKTKNILVILQGNDNLGEGVLNEGLKMLEEGIKILREGK